MEDDDDWDAEDAALKTELLRRVGAALARGVPADLSDLDAYWWIKDGWFQGTINVLEPDIAQQICAEVARNGGKLREMTALEATGLPRNVWYGVLLTTQGTERQIGLICSPSPVVYRG